MPNTKESFSKTMQAVKEQVAKDPEYALGIIMTQVDPDALASAFGLEYLLRKAFDFEKCNIYYCGSVSHPQNQIITNQFNLLNKMHEIKNYKPGGACALVDSHDLIDSRMPCTLDPEKLALILDHHRADVDKLQSLAKGAWIHVEEVGAASTLLVELLREFEIEYEESAKEIYNLLALGIYVDTKNLVSATTRDINAFTYVREFLDPSDISQFIFYDLSSTYFKNLHQALSSLQIQDSKAVASIGFVAKQDRDDLSSIADLLLRRKGVKFVAVWGFVDDVVAISFRSNDMTIPLEPFIKERFKGMGGAKLAGDGRAEGGVTIPLGLSFWCTPENKDAWVALIQPRLLSLLFG